MDWNSLLKSCNCVDRSIIFGNRIADLPSPEVDATRNLRSASVQRDRILAARDAICAGVGSCFHSDGLLECMFSPYVSVRYFTVHG